MMTARIFGIFAVICLNFINLHQCHGFEVIQPQFQTVNPDGSATIGCEYTNDGSVEDVRLNSISQGASRSMLCQMGKKNCKNVAMHSEKPNKWHFVLLNVGPEAMDVEYECQFTVSINDVHCEKRGTPTRLQLGGQETGQSCVSPPSDPHHLWILIGLLAVLFLYGIVLTCLYISLRVQKLLFSRMEAESGTYVEMRKAPLRTNKGFDIYN